MNNNIQKREGNFSIFLFFKKYTTKKLNSFQWKSKKRKEEVKKKLKINIIIEMTHITHIKLNSQRKDT